MTGGGECTPAKYPIVGVVLLAELRVTLGGRFCECRSDNIHLTPGWSNRSGYLSHL